MSFDSRDLALELLDPGLVPLVRLFRHPKGEWDPPPPDKRNLRVDPPPGHKDEYAVLYTADSLPAVAVECHVLKADANDHYTWNSTRAAEYQVARYAFAAPALFIPLDRSNDRHLGLVGSGRAFGGYAPYQNLALDLFSRYGKVVHGLCWGSFHRGQPGRVYALWHRHKATIGLSLTNGPHFPRLPDDPEWQAFLAAYPAVTEIK